MVDGENQRRVETQGSAVAGFVKRKFMSLPSSFFRQTEYSPFYPLSWFGRFGRLLPGRRRDFMSDLGWSAEPEQKATSACPAWKIRIPSAKGKGGILAYASHLVLIIFPAGVISGRG